MHCYICHNPDATKMQDGYNVQTLYLHTLFCFSNRFISQSLIMHIESLLQALYITYVGATCACSHVVYEYSPLKDHSPVMHKYKNITFKRLLQFGIRCVCKVLIFISNLKPTQVLFFKFRNTITTTRLKGAFHILY